MVTCVGGRDKILVSPIIYWTERDVWQFLNDVVKVPHCKLYNKDKAHKYNVEFGIGSTTSRYENVFDCIIETIGWLILNGHFNKEYLNDNP